MLSMLFLLFLVALQPLQSSAQDPCNPDPDCATDSTLENGDKVEDPQDCHNYYLCVTGDSGLDPMGPFDCPDGEYFNTTGKKCIPNELEECTPSCGGGSGNAGTCVYDCPVDLTGKIADRFDCSSYYDCTDTELAVHSCPDEKPFFNGEDCQTDESVCCHCKPYCSSDDVGKNVIDPLDCARFYFCLEEGVVSDIRGSCDTGEHFDIYKNDCSSTAPCLTLCTNVINQEGCIDVFTCEEVGYFASCPKGCDPTYYRCYDDDLGNIIEAETCPEGKVFDPNKTTCVAESECTPSTSRH